MELTLESAFSADGLLGHAAYVVLIASMLMRTLNWLRVLVIVSALLGIAYGSLILNDPVSTFWESLLLLVNIVQLLRAHWRSLRARFTPVEERFVALHLSGLSRGEARAILDAGEWVPMPRGRVLSIEGAPVDYLHYIAEGHADVIVGADPVSVCREGNFVGEMTVTAGAPATATVRVAAPEALVWRIPAQVLRRRMDADDVISREIEPPSRAITARSWRG